MSNNQTKENRLSTLENALCLLDLFTIDEPELCATDIAEKLGVANSTVHRLATTLISEGFVTKDPRTNLYRLGTSVLALSQVVTKKTKIYTISQPILESLFQQCKETVHIGILKDLDVIFLNKIVGSYPIQLLSYIGKRNPAHCTATGQVLLAYQPPDVIDLFRYRELKPYTKNTITNPDDLLKLFQKIQIQGYSLCKDELHEGVSAISAPIRNDKGTVIAAISITGRTQIIMNSQQNFIKLIKKAADDIQRALTTHA